MASYIGRRKFLATLGGAAGWPLAAPAQQPTAPVVGLLSGIDPDDRQLAAFRKGLNEVGYIAGKSVTIEHRSAAGQYDRLPVLANDLVRRQVTVIVTILGTMSALSAKAATTTIPIVFAIGSDPVKAGLVPSLNRPGGNVTGVTFLSNVLAAKRLGLLRELVPGISAVGDLVNPTNPNSAGETNDMQTAAQSLGLGLRIVNASTEREIDAAFANFAEQRLKALIVTADAFFSGRRDQLVSLAARHALPTMYWLREFVADGGLMSYGTSITDAFRAAGVYASRVLKGERPADLPVVQATKFELVINLKAAQTLGVTIPPGVLAIADEVVE
jgi:putative tryptophan/tyrosine transport system substrate-binding protein